MTGIYPHASAATRARIKAPAEPVSVGALGLVCRQLPLCCLLSGWRGTLELGRGGGREEERKGRSPASSYKAANCIKGAPPS